MRRLDEQQTARRKKGAALRERGIDPYPGKSFRSLTLRQAREQFRSFVETQRELTLAGRIVHLRKHGGATFITIADESDQFQLYVKKDVLGEADYRFWLDTLDLGDIVECTGTVFATKKSEETLLARAVRILTKTLRPIPEEHFGLKDVERRLRTRYLDLLLRPDARELFRKKAAFWNAARTFFLSRGFLEVETPILESVPGGAEAKPFTTHYDALGQDVFLRISLELPLKRLLVGGFEKVFEIGRIFRNEGMSPEHLQDYTQLEFYWAYADYHNLMELLPELFREITTAVHGSTKAVNEGRPVDFAKPWKRYDYYELFREHVKLDLTKVTDAELQRAVDRHGIPRERFHGRGRLIDLLYKQLVRPVLIEPGFLLDPPVEVEPLAKRRTDDPQRVERLQVVAWGTELGKGFSELNDPVDQQRRFEEQMCLRDQGDTEAQQLDEDFLEALEYGMPPAAGFGMSERLFSYLVDLPIRETTLFPAMRPEEKRSRTKKR